MTEQINALFTTLNSIATLHPDDIALLDANGRTLTYTQLLDQVTRAQTLLNMMNLRPGDSLVALLPNAIEIIILFLASVRGGFSYAPLPCAATLPEIIRWKSITRAKVCLIANPVSTAMQEKIRNLKWRVDSIEIGGKFKDSLQPSNLLPEKDGFLVMPSSGSTGDPKAILLSVDRLFASANAFLRYHQLGNSPVRFWNYLPMSYLGGLFNLTLIPLAAGGSVFIDETFNGKTFLGFWSTVERYHIDSLWLVPSILRGLLTLSRRIGQQRNYPSIQHCFIGTAPVSLNEKKEFLEVFGIQPLENYGLTETTFIASEKISDLESRFEKSVGNIMPDIEIEFRSSNNKEESESTELWVKTPYAMLGYLNQNGTCETPFDENGFLQTGDFGELINDQLILTGRQRDIIKKGGVLIFLREIEEIVRTYPKITDVAAVKINHSFYGESFNLYICACDSVSDKMELLKSLYGWLHEQIVKDKWPERIIVCQDFPKTSSGKVQKHLLEKWSTVNEPYAYQ